MREQQFEITDVQVPQNNFVELTTIRPDVLATQRFYNQIYFKNCNL